MERSCITAYCTVWQNARGCGLNSVARYSCLVWHTWSSNQFVGGKIVGIIIRQLSDLTMKKRKEKKNMSHFSATFFSSATQCQIYGVPSNVCFESLCNVDLGHNYICCFSKNMCLGFVSSLALLVGLNWVRILYNCFHRCSITLHDLLTECVKKSEVSLLKVPTW